MAESPEHEFLKTHFNAILHDFSNLRLYGFKETERKRFDLSCLIERDWTRPLVGQVLWGHSAGIDKDLRTLLTETQSEIKVYLAKNTMKHHGKFEEVVSDYRSSGKYDDLFRLKAFWVPSDFDADKENQRLVVGNILKSQIVDDILFNVVFGRLSAEDIRFFLSASGVPGLNLAILYHIATKGFINIRDIKEQLQISPGPIREKLPLLSGIGFISTPIGAIAYDDTQKGRIFLELMSRVWNEHWNPPLTSELVYILKKLKCTPVSHAEIESNKEIFPKNPYISMVRTIANVQKQWGIDFSRIDYTEKQKFMKKALEHTRMV